MKSLLVIVCIFAFMVNCLLFLAACQKVTFDEVKHSVSFNHQGNKSKKPIQASLYEKKYSNGEAEFYMDVNSVFCGENVCKLDKVRLFWDELGRYKKFELGDNIRLEKGNAEDFEAQDYIKLDGILRNPDAGLADLYPAELVNQNRGGNVVDALSGATVSIHNEDTVKGAIWTCYTLWHYANGELKQVIRDISGRQYSLAKLTAWLAHADFMYQEFALEQLTRRGEFDDKTFAAITGNDLVKQVALYPKIINYIEALPKHQYQESVLSFLQQENSELALATLESINRYKLEPSSELSLALANSLAFANDFQHSNYILTMLASYSVLSQEVLKKLILILQDQNFLKARGVYWLLSDYPLENKEQDALQRFYQTNEQRL